MYIELKTERLLLRPLNICDLETVYEYSSDIEHTKYMKYLPDRSIEDTRKFLIDASKEWQKEEPTYYEFAILYGSVLIGAVCVYLNEEKTEGEFGWILSKKYLGKGFATEAALAIKSFAVKQLKVKTLFAVCDSRNLNSAHVMEKIGLSFESKGEREYPDERGKAEELKYSCVFLV